MLWYAVKDSLTFDMLSLVEVPNEYAEDDSFLESA